MMNEDVNVHGLIENLKDVLQYFDANDLSIPAIKIEEAINALKQAELEKTE
ncbi:MAG: hypothetical protein AB8B54_12760 [Sphingorhabdus sp.]